MGLPTICIEVWYVFYKELLYLNTSKFKHTIKLYRHFIQVRIYTADGVTAELEKSKLDYLQASILATSTKRIAFTELLLRNMHDFAPDTDSLVEWVCNQLPTSGTLRKSMVDCFRGHNVKASNIVEKIPYDYEFQYLLTI